MYILGDIPLLDPVPNPPASPPRALSVPTSPDCGRAQASRGFGRANRAGRRSDVRVEGLAAAIRVFALVSRVVGVGLRVGQHTSQRIRAHVCTVFGRLASRNDLVHECGGHSLDQSVRLVLLHILALLAAEGACAKANVRMRGRNIACAQQRISPTLGGPPDVPRSHAT